jgi:predicted nucleic acid-binding protein
MNPGSRVVLDTSTLIGAMLRPRSVPGQVFLTAMGTGTLCVSPATLAGPETVLAREVAW